MYPSTLAPTTATIVVERELEDGLEGGGAGEDGAVEEDEGRGGGLEGRVVCWTSVLLASFVGARRNRTERGKRRGRRYILLVVLRV